MNGTQSGRSSRLCVIGSHGQATETVGSFGMETGVHLALQIGCADRLRIGCNARRDDRNTETLRRQWRNHSGRRIDGVARRQLATTLQDGYGLGVSTGAAGAIAGEGDPAGVWGAVAGAEVTRSEVFPGSVE